MEDNQNDIEPQSKRARSANFTKNKKTFLLNIILKFKHILECKKTDSITWREKETTWKKVADLFNSQSPSGVHRSAVSLKKFYENIKKNVRKDVANEKASIKCTGGGKGYFKNDPTVDLALEIINAKTVDGLVNRFDSDVRETPISENQYSHSYGEFSDEGNTLGSETIIFQIENEDTEEEEVNWRDFKVGHLKKPVNKKLIPKSQPASSNDSNLASSSRTPTKEQTSEKDHSWTARRRPTAVALSSSDMAKKYNELADLKIQLVENELEKIGSQNRLKEERDTIEFDLKKKSLCLDIQVKQALLEKINCTTSSEILSFLK